MKKLISILALIILIIDISFATVRTVSNSPVGGSQYNSLQAAYNASANGDSLLIEGTDIPYGFSNCQQYWDKSITIIGIGFNPQKQNPRRVKITATNCFNEFRMRGGASGSAFYGIEFIVPVLMDAVVNNFVFENCKFNVHYNFNCSSSSNFAFRNCVFDGDQSANIYIGGCGTTLQGTISNCVFDGFIDGQGGLFVNLMVDHCLFLSNTGCFWNLYYAQIKNNIFKNSLTISGATYNSEYSNNLCGVSATFPPFPGQGNTGTNNIENTNPNFVNYAPGSFYSSSHDYHLQAGSAAIGAAIDLTDIGLHGGYTNFSEQGEVLINPIIRSLNILNTSVVPNGTLNVQIHATKPDND